MPQQVINIGTVAGDGTGDTLRESQRKANENFSEIYTRYAPNLGLVEPGDTPTGTGLNYWDCVTAGTYTNFGGVVLAANSRGVIFRNSSGVFSISAVSYDITSKVNVSDVVNTLVSTETTKPLSAAQGKALNDKFANYPLTSSLTSKVNVSDIVNTLSSIETTKPLSAAQGKALNDKFNDYASDAEIAIIESDLYTAITAVASGSPKGVFANLAALEGAYPLGHGNDIYVTLDNGHWYYYNVDWQDGGLYQAPITGTIKSNETLALAQRKDDVIYGVIDRYTGEEITLSKVTGTPTVDGIIYFQLGVEYFKRNFTDIDTRWWGAKASESFDSAPAIQAAVNYAFYIERGGEVLLPAGRIKISNTIHIGYGTSYGSIVLKGYGKKYKSEEPFSGTSLVCSFSDRPAINIQGSIQSKLYNFSIKGLLYDWIDSHYLGGFNTAPTLDDTVHTNWNDPSLSATQDDRYRPYAAITIDAYSSADTGTSYPAVDYSYLGGSVPQFNKITSQNNVIEDVFIDGFNTGVVIHPNGSDGNGDFVKLVRVRGEKCKYFVSVCQTQSRTVSMIDCYAFQFFTGITNRTHGLQLGRIDSDIINLGFEYGINLFNINTTRSFPITFTNLFAEAVCNFGTFTDPESQGHPIVFLNSNISFKGLTLPFVDVAVKYKRGVPSFLMSGTAKNIKFIGGQVYDFISIANFQPDVKFEGTKIINDELLLDTTIPVYRSIGYNATDGGIIVNNFDLDFQDISTVNIDLSSGYILPQFLRNKGINKNTRNSCISLYADKVIHNGDNSQKIYNRPKGIRSIDKTVFSGVTTSGIEVTITDAQFNTLDGESYGGTTGDVIYDTENNTVFIIKSHTGTTVVLEAQNNWKITGGVKVLINPFVLTGVLKTTNCRLFILNYPHRGDYVTTGLAITNLKTSNSITQLTPLVVGDLVYLNDIHLQTFYPSQNKITAIDNALKKLTMADNALLNTREDVIFFIRG
jgi:hypothetical protein